MTVSNKTTKLAATNEDTCGPYFPIYFNDDSLEDLTQIHPGVTATAGGTQIILRGSILDRHGDPANGAIIEFWQTNAKGTYRTPKTAGSKSIDPWFNGYGRLRTASGKYSLRTILPGAAPNRAPNITITLFSDGISRVVTQVFFPEHPANATDPLLQSINSQDVDKLIAKYDGRTADGAEVYLFDIIMAGEGETPFFDDLES